MNIPESPYQRLIDIIDTILVKNEVSQGEDLYLHVLDVLSLPQNVLGTQILEGTLKTLEKKGILPAFTGHTYLPKIDKATEKKLIAERQALFDRTKTDVIDRGDKVSLKDEGISFDDEEATIQVGKRKCALPPFKNEHYFCRAMFSYRPNEPVDWSAVYKQMTGGHEDVAEAKYKRTVQDIMYALNNRIKEVINTDDMLFTWENRTIKRNF